MNAAVDTEALSCRELVELVTEYLDGALTGAELQRFEHHLAACGKCQQYLVQLRSTIAATGTLTVDDLAPEVEAALLQAFRGWHDESVASGS
jgi:anti-sigma factor RsiW